ncbi:CpaD family pilus assembly protein [Chelatococcus sp. SYSU_G07232]|uniref:CpaD family pilus assembly protein n=1 Tax=Chelatococcus albus TaxID=3047466 RepID=A0ABT7AFM5_9HYPH|nr:CpaD family pilus assembly protein [Chelatococcus sp. SYSU_G07232]MDJ1157644.1 CpaD family pilus assembly protein [Chelatococcus sp. SYSU_G07232]
MTKPATLLPPLRLAALAAVALPLAACGADRIVTGATMPQDYRERHPIALADAAKTLDVFVTRGHGLDPRQRGDLRDFALDYRRTGKSGLTAYVPTGTGEDAAVASTLGAIRQTLSEAGVPGRSLAVASYRPADPALASTIRLSYRALQARVASQCGEWPADLAGGARLATWRNEPHWNLGCAYQANLAAQVADPLDLVRARPETRVDTAKRLNTIEKWRKSQDPSTQYKQDSTKINQAVGSN